MEIYKCPVCDGVGMVTHNFYNINNEVTTISNIPIICRTCKGLGYIKIYSNYDDLSNAANSAVNKCEDCDDCEDNNSVINDKKFIYCYDDNLDEIYKYEVSDFDGKYYTCLDAVGNTYKFANDHYKVFDSYQQVLSWISYLLQCVIREEKYEF